MLKVALRCQITVGIRSISISLSPTVKDRDGSVGCGPQEGKINPSAPNEERMKATNGPVVAAEIVAVARAEIRRLSVDQEDGAINVMVVLLWADLPSARSGCYR
ncbi:MAG: hypothetical protein QNL12_10300 [Acidimicrobiia bacterium]|nr:hypothetical protein [Acidimicrobiia bacterium]MDX2467696.1 hypothetical protein [Acidimicrobiia bacterium]